MIFLLNLEYSRCDLKAGRFRWLLIQQQTQTTDFISSTIRVQSLLIDFGNDLRLFRISLKTVCFLQDENLKRYQTVLIEVKQAQKWRLEFFIFPRHSESLFELKNTEFSCEKEFRKSLHFPSEKLRMIFYGPSN